MRHAYRRLRHSEKREYGTASEASAALIRSAGARAKKNCAERLAGGVGTEGATTAIYCLLGEGSLKGKPPRRAALRAG